MKCFGCPVRLARLGHRVFIPATGVRIPYGTPKICNPAIAPYNTFMCVTSPDIFVQEAKHNNLKAIDFSITPGELTAVSYTHLTLPTT